jgi:hypothetical protein
MGVNGAQQMRSCCLRFAAFWGPLSGPEIPKISYWRLRKTRGFTALLLG